MTRLRQLLSRAPNYLKRFGLWPGLRLLLQVERRLPPSSTKSRPFDVPGLAGPVWLRESVADHATFWQCMTQAQYDFDCFPQAARLLQCYEEALRAGRAPLIIDCGANIGLASVWYANRLPRARIIAIEPDADNFAVLQKNIAPYAGQITALQGGVWPHSAHLRISNPDGGSAAFRVEELAVMQPGALRGYSMDELCTLASDNSPLIVKIDIEGAQGELFAENTAWVGRTRLLALELDDWQMPWRGTSRSFFRCLSQYPFDYLLGGESIFCFRDDPHLG